MRHLLFIFLFFILQCFALGACLRSKWTRASSVPTAGTRRVRLATVHLLFFFFLFFFFFFFNGWDTGGSSGYGASSAFSKVLSIGPLYSKYARALTFENVWKMWT